MLFLAFVLLSFAGAIHHELWLDEMDTWLVARDSHSILQLFHNSRYDGHPFIWYTLLYLLSAFTSSAFSMQILHLAIVVSTAFLFLKYAPFTLLQKCCILFGYFFLFEYNIICRTYSLTWLFLNLFCICYTSQKRNYTGMLIALLLLSNTHFLSLLLSLPLFAAMTHAFFTDSEKSAKQRYPVYLLLFTAGLFLSALWIMPPIDTLIIHNISGHAYTGTRLSKAFSFYFKGMYTLPDFSTPYFWNSNYLVTHLKPLSIGLSLLVFTGPFIFFYRNRVSLFVFYSGTLLITGASCILELFTGVHYMGYVFMTFLVCIWMEKQQDDGGGQRVENRRNRGMQKIKNLIFNPFLWSILITQLLSGCWASYTVFQHPFSQGSAVSASILTTSSAKDLIVVNPYYSGPVISGYLQRQVFYPILNQFGSFYFSKKLPLVSPEELAQRTLQCINRGAPDRTFIVMDFSPDNFQLMHHLVHGLHSRHLRIKEIRLFKPAISPGEAYWYCCLEKSGG